MTTNEPACVAMKHAGAAIVQAQLASLTREQELAFWHERTRKLEERKRLLQPSRQGNREAAESA